MRELVRELLGTGGAGWKADPLTPAPSHTIRTQRQSTPRNRPTLRGDSRRGFATCCSNMNRKDLPVLPCVFNAVAMKLDRLASIDPSPHPA